ncbi:MAG: response regulator [Thermoguttaceae bacterium]|jgi:CheY-like chemotaxis protein
MALILLVEDDPMQREQYALYLRSRDGGGHQVDEAGSATIAVRMAKEKAFDLVLLDIMLAYAPEDETNPEINDFTVDYGRRMGVYVYRELKKLPTPPRIGLVSVVDDFATLSEFPDTVGRLTKYFNLQALGEAVSGWLR